MPRTVCVCVCVCVVLIERLRRERERFTISSAETPIAIAIFDVITPTHETLRDGIHGDVEPPLILLYSQTFETIHALKVHVPVQYFVAFE